MITVLASPDASWRRPVTRGTIDGPFPPELSEEETLPAAWAPEDTIGHGVSEGAVAVAFFGAAAGTPPRDIVRDLHHKPLASKVPQIATISSASHAGRIRSPEP